jgi:hypothetical protein
MVFAGMDAGATPGLDWLRRLRHIRTRKLIATDA